MKIKMKLSVVLLFAINMASAQIPNAGFENWNSMGAYNSPESWSCLNDMTSSMSVYTCTKGTPGNPGNAYLKLTSKTVTGMGVVPGIVVSGSLDQTSMQPTGGFAFSQRPANLTGSWQHMIFGSSQGYIDILLTRWDSNMQMRMPVATAHRVLTGMAMSWATFSIPLTYVDGNNPDSCIITLSASGNAPSNNDYLYIDNLAFSGVVTGIAPRTDYKTLSVYPNPATNEVIVELPANVKMKIDIQISDVRGVILKSLRKMNASSKLSIDIKGLPKGNYVIKILADKETLVNKFIKK